ncbi:MAG: glycosyltransferase [Planctomycetota bacterium]|jgi:dolichol-phosphate mannosyltransferase
MLSVIVPTYNEKDNVRALIERTLGVFGDLSEDAEILIVDDDSPDGTAAEVRAAAEELGAAERVKVIVREEDRGLAKSVMAGFEAAKGDVLAVMDADLSHPPELLPQLLKPIRSGDAEVTVASRRVEGGGVENWPIRRRLASWFAGLLARPLVPVRDTTSGFFALRKECIDGVELRPIGYKIGLEVLARASYANAREVPFTFTDRRAGASKMGGAVMAAYLVQLAALYRERFPRLVGYMQFSLVGLLGMMVDFAVFEMLYQYVGLAAMGPEAGTLIAQSGSFVFAASFNFMLNRLWTFRERAARAKMSVFILVCLGGYVMRSGLVWALVASGKEGAGERWPVLGAVVAAVTIERLSLFLGIVFASVWNFLASRRWAFPEGGAAEPDAEAERAVIASASPGELRARARAVALVLGLGALHLVFSSVVGLASDEAYYWQWSRHLDWGYHDHPPMVAYLIAVGTRVAGVNAVGVRLATTVMWTATLWIVYKLATGRARMLGAGASRDDEAPSRAGLWAAGALAATLLFSIGGLFATPDVPLVFFWTATVALGLRALRKRTLKSWLAAGVTLGLGMVSKYPMVLLPVALVAALATTREGRKALGGPGPWLAAATGALVCLPMIIWMFRGGFASVFFQLGHGLGGAAASKRAAGFKTFGEFLGGQAGIATPVLFGVLVWVLVRNVRALVRRWRTGETAPEGDGATDSEQVTLALLVFPAALTFLVFGLASLRAKPEVNWPAAGYMTLIVLAGPELARLARGTRGRMAVAWTAVGFAAILSAYGYVGAAWPAVPLPRALAAKAPDRTAFARWARDARASEGDPGARAPVLACSYQVASLLAFYLPDHPETDAPFEAGSGAQYVAWRSREIPAGTPVWYFTRTPGDARVRELLEDPRLVSTHVDKRGDTAMDAYEAYFGRLRRRVTVAGDRHERD